MTTMPAARAPGAGHNRRGKPTEHAKVGQTMLGMMHSRGQALRNIHDLQKRTHLWYYRDGLWTMLPEPAKWLNHAIEVTLRATGKAHKSKDKFVDGSPQVHRAQPRHPGARRGHVGRPRQGPDPLGVDRSGHARDRAISGRSTTRPGGSTSTTIQMRPARCGWNCSAITSKTSPRASASSSSPCCRTIAGTTLIDQLPKALKRALVLYGASDTGKSILLRVLSAILADKTISIALADISGPHGLEEFMFRRPWVLDEAFDNNVWLLSASVKAIISREPLGINRKNLPMLTKEIIAPCLWGTNHPPSFKESTEAMVNRLLIVLLTRVFDKDNPVGVAAKAKAVNPAWEPSDLILDRERAGVFTWMMAGLKRVLERGNFVNTEEGKAMLAEMRLNANPVAGFVADCIEYDVDAMISTADFHAAFIGWRLADHGDEKVNFSRASLGRYLSALADPNILQDKRTFRRMDGTRFYVGIRLNEQGGAHFGTVAARQILTPDLKFQGISATKEDTYQLILPEWLVHPKVTNLRNRKAAKDRKAAS